MSYSLSNITRSLHEVPLGKGLITMTVFSYALVFCNLAGDVGGLAALFKDKDRGSGTGVKIVVGCPTALIAMHLVVRSWVLGLSHVQMH